MRQTNAHTHTYDTHNIPNQCQESCTIWSITKKTFHAPFEPTQTKYHQVILNN